MYYIFKERTNFEFDEEKKLRIIENKGKDYNYKEQSKLYSSINLTTKKNEKIISSNENAKSSNFQYSKIVNELENKRFDFQSSKIYDSKKNYGRFISLGIFAIALKNTNKVIYFDIYHKKIEINQESKTSYADIFDVENKKNFEHDNLYNQNEQNGILDDYILYNVTEYIEDKLKLIVENNQKEKLFAKLSHEFKTPLNSIIGMINEILDMNINNDFSSKLISIKNLTNYMIFMISDIIQYSNMKRIEDLKLYMTEINMKVILSFCYEILNCLISCDKNKNDNITTHLIIKEDFKNCLIIGDEYRIKQILLNFISISVKFTNHGKIYLKCKKLVNEKKNVFKITLKDTGIGIKEEERIELFGDDEMLDVNQNFKNNFARSGSGLSICKKLVKKMEMDIVVKSENLKGSKFSLLIPYKYKNKIEEDFLEISVNNSDEDIRFKRSEKYSYKKPEFDKIELTPMVLTKKNSERNVSKVDFKDKNNYSKNRSKSNFYQNSNQSNKIVFIKQILLLSLIFKVNFEIFILDNQKICLSQNFRKIKSISKTERILNFNDEYFNVSFSYINNNFPFYII